MFCTPQPGSSGIGKSSLLEISYYSKWSKRSFHVMLFFFWDRPFEAIVIDSTAAVFNLESNTITDHPAITEKPFCVRAINISGVHCGNSLRLRSKTERWLARQRWKYNRKSRIIQSNRWVNSGRWECACGPRLD